MCERHKANMHSSSARLRKCIHEFYLGLCSLKERRGCNASEDADDEGGIIREETCVLCVMLI